MVETEPAERLEIVNLLCGPERIEAVREPGLTDEAFRFGARVAYHANQIHRAYDQAVLDGVAKSDIRPGIRPGDNVLLNTRMTFSDGVRSCQVMVFFDEPEVRHAPIS